MKVFIFDSNSRKTKRFKGGLKKVIKIYKKANLAVDRGRVCGYKYFPTDMAKHEEKPCM